MRTGIIKHLFDLGGELCMPGYTMIPDGYVDRLEHDLDALNEELPPLKDFILPGGSESAARCHLARNDGGSEVLWVHGDRRE